MIRAFGYYSFSGKIPESFKNRMSSFFETKQRWREMLKFSRGSLFILYEHARSQEAKNYYHIDPGNGDAFFVVGDIHPCGTNFSNHPSNFNLGRWLQQMHTEQSWSFAENLRGMFNIVAWKKDRLFLINDILGLSPMYVLPTAGGCFFCSEAEPIAEMVKDHAVDYGAVVDFLVYGFIPLGRTFFQGLRNQMEGSVWTIDKTGCEEKPYASFQSLDKRFQSFNKNVDLLRETFKEAVAIRAKGDRVFSALTGGWDTRYTIANLLELKKKVTVFTIASQKHDLVIAREIAKKFNLSHIVKTNNPLPEECRSALVLKFRGDHIKENFSRSKKSIYNKDKNALGSMGFFTSPIFSGCFGTELMGGPPLSFTSRLALDRTETSKLIFSDRFLQKNTNELKWYSARNSFLKQSQRAPQNHIHCFLTQIGRSYLNSHYGRDWERPTSMVGYRRLSPFADNKFVGLLSSLDGQRYLNYRAYEKLFEKFYPEFLKIPWTYGRFRKKSLARTPLHLNFKNDFLHQFVRENASFRNFMRNNKMFRASSFVMTHRTKELYFLFCWLRDCHDLLRKPDRLPLC